MSGRARLDPAAAAQLQGWMALLSRKWTLAVLGVLAAGPTRYNALLSALDPIAPKVLTDALRRLESGGLVVARREGRIGRSYSLTPDGRFLLETAMELHHRLLLRVAA